MLLYNYKNLPITNNLSYNKLLPFFLCCQLAGYNIKIQLTLYKTKSTLKIDNKKHKRINIKFKAKLTLRVCESY